MGGDRQKAMFWAICETFNGRPRSYELEDPGASAGKKIKLHASPAWPSGRGTHLTSISLLEGLESKLPPAMSLHIFMSILFQEKDFKKVQYLLISQFFQHFEFSLIFMIKRL